MRTALTFVAELTTFLGLIVGVPALIWVWAVANGVEP